MDDNSNTNELWERLYFYSGRVKGSERKRRFKKKNRVMKAKEEHIFKKEGVISNV